MGIYVACSLVIIWAMLGWLISEGIGWIALVFAIIGIYGAWRMLRPSQDNAELANRFLDEFEKAK